ncbi:MAG TPA: ATP-binding cassette domain-containing protein, partial [Desulfomonilaceae bacterium]|nr:ATP-binding cassette domain-containing protein [Desulfomonilaceae bacterium]
MDAKQPLLRIEKITKCYGSADFCEVFPLRGIDLEIAQGERIILFGKSGSGKTTFLNLVGGVDVPTSGRIFFDGVEITALPPAALALYRRK